MQASIWWNHLERPYKKKILAAVISMEWSFIHAMILGPKPIKGGCLILRFGATEKSFNQSIKGEYWRIIEFGDCHGYAMKLWKRKLHYLT